LDEIKLDELFMQRHVINTSSKCNETYIVTANDIHEYEKSYGTITAKSCVMLYTGWSKHWDSPAEYHNHHKYPSISIDAAQILLDRDVFAIGIDTMSPDRMADDFPIHRMWLGADKILIENVANLDQMPAVGSHIIAFPLKIKDAVEFPVRVVGIVAQ
jgi:kynurenine formamidase